MKRFSILIIAMALSYCAAAQYSISIGSSKQCEGETITFSHDLPNGYNTFNWNLGDGTTDSNSTVKHQYSSAGTYDVKLEASRGGENITLSFSITINALPQVEFNIDTTAQQNTRVFTVETSASSLNYEWEFGDGSKQNTTDNSTKHSYGAPGTYDATLVTSDELGCTDTVSHSLQIDAPSKVPNVFTPNGDGQNDYFMITATNGSKLKLEVFNRWGYKIFSRSGTENIVWDGYNPQGTLVSPGTYFYTITVEEGTTSYDPLNGYITVYY